MTSQDALARLAGVIEARCTGDADKSYVARLFAKGTDAMLKKVGEEATELVMAAKDGQASKIVAETADLWFHSMLVLAAFGLKPQDVIDELQRREGLSGLDEFASREARAREDAERQTPAGLKFETMTADPNCIFCKIVTGQIPSKKVFEDDELLAFHDLHPWAPVHVLVIPKLHIAMLSDVTADQVPLLGRMLALAPRLMKDLGVTNGFRTVVNTGPDGGQEVYHLHMHVMGGPRPWLKG